jgi:hypothetical protein
MVKPRTGYQLAKERMTAALRAEVAAHGRAEEQLHIAIVELLNATAAPGVRFHHVPNGGKRSKREAARFRLMGVKAGVSDLVISMPGGRTGYMEIKAANGRLSEEQENFLAAMAANGNLTAVVRSLEEATATLTEWGAIRRARVAA